MSQLNPIDQLEHDIWILKGKLLTLKQQLPYTMEGMEKERLAKLELELQDMQEEIKRMKETPASSPAPDIQPVPFKEPSALKETSAPKKPAPRQEKSFDLEKTFGTGIMGITASILVFISIIIFGSLLIPHLSKGIMTLLMFLASFALAGSGMFLLRKNETNKFYLSLCACGVTAIAVSLFVTRIFFGLIDNMAFLCFISVWMALTAYLCHKYHYLFRIIGELGILITSILGITEILFLTEWYFYIILVFIYGSSSLAFHYAKPRESYEKNAFSHIKHTIALTAFSLPLQLWNKELLFIEISFMCLSFFFLVLLELLIVWNEKVTHGVLFYLLSGIQMVLLAVTVSKAYQMQSSLFFVLVSLFLIYLFSRKQTKQETVGDLCAVLLYLAGGWNLMESPIGCSLLCVIPPFLYGYFRHKKVFLYSGLVGMVSTFTNNDTTILSFLFMTLIPFILFLFLARKESDHRFSSIGYGWMMLILYHSLFGLFDKYGFAYSESITLSFLALAFSHLLIIKGNLLKEESKPFEITSFLLTGILMIFGISVLYKEYRTFFVILAALGLFVINSKKLLQKSERFGYYIALKYTIFMLVVLDVSWNLAIVYSVCMLLFSFFSILAGFFYEHKSFRIYGLLLSMLRYSN